MFRDLRFAIRTLLRAPGFTFVAALTLGIGIGANAAMVGLFDALLYRPPPGLFEPERLVRFEVESSTPTGTPLLNVELSTPQYEALSEAEAGFVGIAAYAQGPLRVGSGDGARNEPVVLVSGEYFEVVGAAMHLGQPIGPEHDSPSAPGPVAVLSYDYWQRAYGGDPAVLGRAIQVGDESLTIIGVASRSFVGVDLGSPALWVPLALAGPLGYDPEMIASPFVSWIRVVGRLADGRTMEQAEAPAQAALLAAAEAGLTAPPPRFAGGGGMPSGARIQIGGGIGGGPGAPELRAPPPRLRLTPIRGAGSRPGAPPVQGWYLGVTSAVLLIACANVANLLLARGVYREHELAVRASLGASRGRIARFLLAEAAALAVAGVGVGLGVALAVWRLLPAAIELPPLPPFFGGRTLALLVAIGVLTVGLFAIVPLIGISRPNLNRLLSGTSPRVGTRFRGRSALVIVQFALSVVLLVGAGLFIRSYRSVNGIDLGYARDNHLLVTVRGENTSEAALGDLASWETARDRLLAGGGVAAAALATVVPYEMRIMAPMRGDAPRETSDAPPAPALLDFVDENYFDAMGLAILEGRPFLPTDREGSEPVAIVSRSFALEEFGGGSPIGRCVIVGPATSSECARVVGVADDARLGELTDDSPRLVFRPISQRTMPAPLGGVLHLRVSGDPERVADRARAELTALFGPGAEVRTRGISELIAPQLAPWRGSAALMSTFAAVGVLLATIGLFGVVSFLVARRTREIGIRLALGARPRQILHSILGDASRLVAWGAGIGLLAAVLSARSFSSLFYGVGPVDLTVLGSTVLLLGLVALLAALAPAQRAAAVDPMTALRED